MAGGRTMGAEELTCAGRSLVHDLSTSGDLCYITEDGRTRAVLLDIQRYNALMDLVEEAELPTIDDPQQLKIAGISVRGIPPKIKKARAAKH